MKCPHCESENVIKSGKLKNKFVVKQGYRCKKCGRYFVERDGFEGMTYPKEIVNAVLYLFVEELSLSMIRDFIYQQYGYLIYDSSILNWVRKYTNTIEELKHEKLPRLKIEGRNLFVEWLPLSKIRNFMYQQHGYQIKNGSILNLTSKYEFTIEENETNEPKIREY